MGYNARNDEIRDNVTRGYRVSLRISANPFATVRRFTWAQEFTARLH